MLKNFNLCEKFLFDSIRHSQSIAVSSVLLSPQKVEFLISHYTRGIGTEDGAAGSLTSEAGNSCSLFPVL
jgi:hypothetical protein